jgi:predicted DsbA family dithiol-disulfide isomerase
MEGDLVAELLATTTDLDGIGRELDIAQQMGVTSVPCAVINQQFAVMGAQPVETFMAALETAASHVTPS